MCGDMVTPVLTRQIQVILTQWKALILTQFQDFLRNQTHLVVCTMDTIR